MQFNSGVEQASKNTMKSLVFLALLGACAALPFPFIQDTPEVQAERQRFLQLYTKAAQAAAAAPDNNIYSGGQPNYHHAAPHRFSAPQTHHQYTPKWTGPLASKVPAGLPGSEAQVRNTPEVEAAIANFNKAYSAAARSTHSSSPHHFQPSHHTGHYQPSTGHYQHSSGHYQPSTGHQQKWTGPMAATVPAGLPGSVSQVPATAAVQAAHASFGQAYQQQLRSVLG